MMVEKQIIMQVQVSRTANNVPEAAQAVWVPLLDLVT